MRTIFASGEKPGRVVYFCEPDIPVYKRHKLQKDCHTSYSATLDILDGQAIADMLADHDTSWIADEYLNIPSELWPTITVDEKYTIARERWLIQNPAPENYADFIEIKRGLRTSTFEEEARRDLRGWIEAMRSFLADGVPDRLRQKARYEISVAELRGHGSLDPAVPLVETFLANATSNKPGAELLDAAVLNVYAWASRGHGESSISSEQVAAWVKQNDEVIAHAVVAPASASERCLLLEAQAMTALIPRETDTGPNDTLGRLFDRWESFIEAVREMPLFPINHIADIFEKATELIGPNDRLRSLIVDVDKLVAERAGKGAAANRARRRAWSHVDAGRYVAAIDEFHNTKENWFTGENIEGSILAMLALSRCYEELHFHAAARLLCSWRALHHSSCRKRKDRAPTRASCVSRCGHLLRRR